MTSKSISLPVVILAGGLGTRLRTVVSDVPKPLAPVAGRPFIARLIDQATAAGASEVILCVGYKASIMADFVETAADFQVPVRLSVEDMQLGTAGAIGYALPMFDALEFVVMNGDSYAAVDIEGMLEAHRACDARATIAVTRVADSSRYGSVEVAEDFQITAFREKTESTGPGYINSGVYVIKRSILDRVPVGVSVSIERDIFPALAGRGLYAFSHSGTFIDIGTPGDFNRAQLLFAP